MNPHEYTPIFTPGVRLIRWTEAEDFTAGELNEPFDTLPTERWVDGSQWHTLTYLGSSWSKRDTRYPATRWADWVGSVVANGGVVTLDAGPNWDPQMGPIGAISEDQMAQLRSIQAAVKTATIQLPENARSAKPCRGISRPTSPCGWQP